MLNQGNGEIIIGLNSLHYQWTKYKNMIVKNHSNANGTGDLSYPWAEK